MQLIRREGLVLAVGVALVASGAAAPADGGVAARVSLSARPTTLTWAQTTTLFGAVDSGEEHQNVTIEVKTCPLTSYREVTAVQTGEGGNFTLPYGAGVNSSVRAVWRSATSAPVELRQTPRLALDRIAGRRFQVGAASQGQLWRKKVIIQRRSGSKWVAFKTVTLSKTHGGAGQAFVWIDAEFTVPGRRGTSIRAVLTAAQARPCYLATVSNTVRL